MNMTTRSLLIAATALILSGPVLAEGDSIKIKIGRDYTSDVQTGAVTTTAIGQQAHAAANVGGVQGRNMDMQVGRDFRTTVKSGAITTTAIGKDVSAFTNLGGIQQTK